MFGTLLMESFDVICPIYNEQQTIPPFMQRIESLFKELNSRYSSRLIFIDNASTDDSQKIVKDICSKNSNVSLIVMSRNFGYQCSVECGLRNSTADYTGVVDVDCEDPPELFIRFLKHIEEGYDVVYGERVDRHESSILKGIRKIFYRLTRALADDHFILDMAEFCVLNRAVRESILVDNNSFPFIRASIGRVGFSIKNVPFKRQMRIAGQTHYNFFRMATFAIAGILSSSTLWLRIPAYLLPFWFLAILAMSGVLICTGNQAWYQSIVITSFLFIGFAVTGISIYLARVYKNGLNRPNYIINKKKSIFQHLQESKR